MAELRGLSVKVPIRFSEKAQRELYETCMGYKKLAEVRGAENAKLRELVRDMWHDGMCECDRRGDCATCEYGYLDRMRELGVLDE